MEFSKQEYWNVLPCPPPGDLTNPGIEPAPPVSPVFQFSSVQSLSHVRLCDPMNWEVLIYLYLYFIYQNENIIEKDNRICFI